jgi:hypothetical protein
MEVVWPRFRDSGWHRKSIGARTAGRSCGDAAEVVAQPKTIVEHVFGGMRLGGRMSSSVE